MGDVGGDGPRAVGGVPRRDKPRATAPPLEAALADIEGVPLPIPDFGDFDKYNIQLEKARIEAAGYTLLRPAPRAPYRDLPADWAEVALNNGKAWAAMRAEVREQGR